MKPIASLIVAVAIGGLTGLANAAPTVHAYKVEANAQKHCPNDTIVYGAPANRIYHMKGARYYGNMKDGRFVCQGEADAGGWHMAPNGQ